MEKIGFIGLGKMGLPMALNICKAGYKVLVHSTKPASAEQVVQAGGTSLSSYQQVAEQADIIITIVPADKEIKELYLGDKGILNNMRPGTACIEMTSALGETKVLLQKYITEHNLAITVLDAPVSGGVAGATNGKLTIMVGCNTKEELEKYRPVLEAMGEKIYYTGDVGSGSNIKMINQMLNAANTAIAAEGICLAKQLGIDLNILCEVVNKSSGGSYIFERNVPKYMLTGNHTPGFRLALMEKDVSLFMAAARNEHAFTPVAELVYQIYKATSNQGMKDKNYTCIAEWLENNQKKNSK